MAVAPSRILVVEDDGAVRDALVRSLRGQGYEAMGRADGREVASLVDAFRPDLAVLDVRLRVGPGGLQLARSIRDVSDIPVLFLTAADALEDRLAGFDAGADDYLVKPFAMTEVQARIRALLRRSGRIGSDTWTVADVVVDEGARTVVRGESPVELTPREFDLLAFLARHPGRVFSKVQLLGEVWGFESYDPNLVEVHVSALRRKLEQHGARLVHTVRNAGYTLRA